VAMIRRLLTSADCVPFLAGMGPAVQTFWQICHKVRCPSWPGKWDSCLHRVSWAMPLGDRPPEPLSPAEVRALLAACSAESLTGMRNRALLVVLWRAGLRCAEALALRPCDVDFAAGTLRVRFGKGRRSRTVGIDGEALTVVRAWLGAREAAGVASDFLFCDLKPGYAGAPMQPRYVRAEVARIAVRAGIRHRVHPHGLRHTHASELSLEGWPVSFISRQLGHSSSAVTAVYIDHVAPAEVIDRARLRSWAVLGGNTSCRGYRWETACRVTSRARAMSWSE
jgi:integrase